MTKVAIIGAGKGGVSLIEILFDDPLVQIVGVSDVDKDAPGVKLARKLKIPVTQNYKKLLQSKKADLVIDVSGNPSVEETLHVTRPPGTAIIGGPSAKLMWQLIEERIRSKEKIEQHLLEYQSLYRLYVKEVELAIAEERTRIACDIHDGLVQTLVGLSYRLDYCADQMEKNPARSIASLHETKKLLKEGISEAREVIFNLRPILIDQSGLSRSLENYLKTYHRQYQIKTRLEASINERLIASQTKIFVFRIIQEALANVQKHAHAKRVSVKVSIRDEMMHVSINDNGIGFDQQKVKRDHNGQRSFGLQAITERARLLGGQAKITSRLGKGTRVVIQIPIRDMGVQ
ncbi:MAG: histidine kinase [Nitrospiria bacterium]